MTAIIVPVPKNIKLAVIGDIHEHSEQFFSLIEKITLDPNVWVVSLGDIYDKGWGVKHAEKITDALMQLSKEGRGFVLQGNHEIKNIQKATRSFLLTRQLAWLSGQPLAIKFEFYNGTSLLVVHGGILPYHTWTHLNCDIESSFVRDISESGKMIKLRWEKTNNGQKLIPTEPNGKPWHLFYDGRLGYVISGHDAQKDGIPKFYNYSCNIDTSVCTTGILTCLMYSDSGRGDIVSTIGPAFRTMKNNERN